MYITGTSTRAGFVCCNFSGNRATTNDKKYGGAVYNEKSTVILRGIIRFQDNIAHNGSGIYSKQGELDVIADCPTGQKIRSGRSTIPWPNTIMDSHTKLDFCTPCDKGRWSNKTGLLMKDECERCSPGKWSDETGLVEDEQCAACSAGKFSHTPGLRSDSECVYALQASGLVGLVRTIRVDAAAEIF